MSWKTEVVEMIRVLIGDTDDTNEEYTDERLTRAATISAHQLVVELEFTQTYVVAVLSETITPDPTEVSPKDDSFLYLLSLKSAMLIVSGELKVQAKSGVSITDGPSKIDLTGVYRNLKDLADDLAKRYEQAKIQYKLEKICHGIMTPYTVQNIPPYSAL